MKVSVITAVYNDRDTILRTVESVREQTYGDIEYIIVDGDSTDGTVELLKNSTDGIDRFVSEPDSGIYDALNKGVTMATGDIIGFLHSDDVFYDEEVIARVVKAFDKTGADIVYGNGQYLDSRNKEKVRRIYRSRPFKKWFLRFGWIPLHTTFYVRSDIYEKYGLFDTRFRIAGDYDISLRWFLNDDIEKHYLNRWIVKMNLGGVSTDPKFQRVKSREDYEIIRSNDLFGLATLFFKIGRKVPQYLLPVFKKY